MTLTTSEPGEQSVPGQRCNIVRTLLHLHYCRIFLPPLYFFPVYLLVALVISYTFHIIIITIFNVVIG